MLTHDKRARLAALKAEIKVIMDPEQQAAREARQAIQDSSHD